MKVIKNGKILKDSKRKKQETELDYLLSQLLNEKNKTTAIVKAVEEGLTNNPQYIEKTIQYYLSKGYREYAARLFRKMGNIERANKIYDEVIQDEIKRESKRGEWGSFGNAVNAAIEKGDIELAINIHEEYDTRGNGVPDAAELARRKVGIDREIKVWEKAAEKAKIKRDYEKAAGYEKKIGELFEENGNTEKAKEFYRLASYDFETSNHLRTAAESAEKAGDLDRAIELYEKKGYFYITSAELAGKKGDLEKALQIYEKNKDFVRATKIAEKLGHENRILDYLKIVDNPEFEVVISAARILNKKGRLEEASKLIDAKVKEYEGKDYYGYFHLIADLLREMGDVKRAESYQKLWELFVRD